MLCRLSYIVLNNLFPFFTFIKFSNLQFTRESHSSLFLLRDRRWHTQNWSIIFSVAFRLSTSFASKIFRWDTPRTPYSTLCRFCCRTFSTTSQSLFCFFHGRNPYFYTLFHAQTTPSPRTWCISVVIIFTTRSFFSVLDTLIYLSSISFATGLRYRLWRRFSRNLVIFIKITASKTFGCGNILRFISGFRLILFTVFYVINVERFSLNFLYTTISVILVKFLEVPECIKCMQKLRIFPRNYIEGFKQYDDKRAENVIRWSTSIFFHR